MGALLEGNANDKTLLMRKTLAYWRILCKARVMQDTIQELTLIERSINSSDFGC